LHAAEPKRDWPEIAKPRDRSSKCHVPPMRTPRSGTVHPTQHDIIDRSPNQELSDFYDNRPEIAKTRDRPPKQMPRLSDEASTKRDSSSYTTQADVIHRPPKQELSDFQLDLPPRKAPSEDGEDDE
jgi:hypothetical protein